MLKERDKNVIYAIESFKVMNTEQIKELFFKDVSGKRCRERLRILTEKYKLIKRERTHIGQSYVYYDERKPKQLEHMLKRVDFFIEINKRSKVDYYTNELAIANIRADMYIETFYKDELKSFLVEVQCTNQPNIKKYENLYHSMEWKTYFNEFPTIIIISHQKPRIKSRLKFIVIDYNLSDIDKIFNTAQNKAPNEIKRRCLTLP